MSNKSKIIVAVIGMIAVVAAVVCGSFAFAVIHDDDDMWDDC